MNKQARLSAEAGKQKLGWMQLMQMISTIHFIHYFR
jgi:hypothetical protein